MRVSRKNIEYSQSRFSANHGTLYFLICFNRIFKTFILPYDISQCYIYVERTYHNDRSASFLATFQKPWDLWEPTYIIKMPLTGQRRMREQTTFSFLEYIMFLKLNSSKLSDFYF